MSDQLETIGRMMALAASAEAHAPDPEVRALLATMGAGLLAGDDRAIPVLGLPVRWRSGVRRQEQRLALFAVRDLEFSELAGRPAARAVWATLRRYEGTAWPRDSRTGLRPDGASGRRFDVLSRGKLPAEDTLVSLFSKLADVK